SQIQDTSALEIENIFDINSTGTILMCRESAKRMISGHFGRIINISSMWGISGASCESVYSASKASVIGLTRSLAKELGPSGITVNCIAPGLIDTKMNAGLTKEAVDALVADTPVERIGSPDDIASAVLFFCSAPFVTGQTLCVDGGLTL
ncbi:MAG: SDR family oxidoreductase, partial [Oscillospiraceae bacterium]|nr:SDR family oxidoreductase [Oscillospiraceae bacterium]